MPQIGEIKRARDIGLNYEPYHKLMWMACEICGKERWVSVIRNKPIFRRCQKCATRDPITREKQRQRHLGEGSTWWKGGIRHDMDGYVYIYINSDSPYISMVSQANRNVAGGGYISEHRLVMAKHLGRLLKPYEVVHHKNHIRNDNRIENLYLTTIREHQAITALENRLQGAENRIIKLEAENTLLRRQLELIYSKAYTDLQEATK